MKLPLSVFFPAYNDASALPALVDKAMAVLHANTDDFELIVVNDGSHDATGEVLDQLSRRHAPWMKVITHQENRGYGAALRSGFAAAQKEFVFYTDGDGQYDVGELPGLLQLMDGDVGLVCLLYTSPSPRD